MKFALFCFMMGLTLCQNHLAGGRRQDYRGHYDLAPVCRHAPEWTVKGRQIMRQLVGKTTLVAFISLGCAECQQQLKGIQGMADQFRRSNMDLRVVIVAPMREGAAFVRYWRQMFRSNKEIRIVQETASEPVWARVGARDNEIRIYDNCGREAFVLQHPVSSLRQQYVMHNLWQTYISQVCGVCTNGVSDHDPYFAREYKGPGKPSRGRLRKGQERSRSRSAAESSRSAAEASRSAAYYPPTPPSTTNTPIAPSMRTAKQTATRTQLKPTLAPDANDVDDFDDAPEMESSVEDTTAAPTTAQTSSWWDPEQEFSTVAPLAHVDDSKDIFAGVDPEYFKTATTDATNQQIPKPTTTPKPRPTLPTNLFEEMDGCDEYSEKDCRELQQMYSNDSMTVNKTQEGLLHDCCYKGIYLTDACKPSKCNNNTYSICCVQKLLQAHYVCCHSDDLKGDTMDEFNKCCYQRFVYLDSHDPCCPASVALDYWDTESSLYELCMPNVRINFERLSFNGKMRDGKPVTLNLAELSPVLDYQCPYERKRGTFFFYNNDPMDKLIFDINKEK